MPRRKEFEPDDVLDKAMALFWEKGYVQTSLDDLVQHTGVSLYGLYSTFGDKKELFIKVLDRYRHSVIAGLLGELNEPNASLSAIRRYFEGFIEISKKPERKLGCLMCNTAIELSPHDDEIAQKVDAYLQQVTSALHRALSNAVRQGELKPRTDVDALSDFLVGVVLGTCLYSRTPASSEAMEQYIKTALSVLN